MNRVCGSNPGSSVLISTAVKTLLLASVDNFLKRLAFIDMSDCSFRVAAALQRKATDQQAAS